MEQTTQRSAGRPVTSPAPSDASRRPRPLMLVRRQHVDLLRTASAVCPA